MRFRRRAVILVTGGLACLVLIALVAVAQFPEIVRRVVVWQVESITRRPVTLDAARFDPFTGEFELRGFRLAEHDGSPFADFETLRGRLHRRSLVRGHVWIRELTLSNSTVRVVRLGTSEFNLSDLVERTAEPKQRTIDITVDRFVLAGGTVTLEDRMLTPWRTWKSERIALDVQNVSTRAGAGTATGSTLLNGSPASIRVDGLRLVPVHLHAIVDVKDADLALARLYLPPKTPVTIERGRLTTSIDLVHDARAGTRVNGDGRVADAVVLRRDQKDPVLAAPDIRFAFTDLTAVGGRFALTRFEATGGGTTQTGDDATRRFAIKRFRASLEALTWPVTSPARLDVVSSVPGGGEITAKGTVQIDPARAEVDVRMNGVDVAAWARFVPIKARVSGTADATMKVIANLGPAVTATVRGTAGVSRLVVMDGDRRLVTADRAEALGIEIGWPLKVAVDRVRVRAPSGVVERNERGEFPLLASFAVDRSGEWSAADVKRPSASTPARQAAKEDATPLIALTEPIRVREIVVEDGRIGWRDAAVKPAAKLDLDGVRVSVRDAVWPLAGPVPVSLHARDRSGGRVTATGQVALEPLDADLHVVANGLDVTAAAPYVPTPAQFRGRADADLRVHVAKDAELTATARGRANVHALSVSHGGRPVVSVERADVTGLDVDWPTRIAVQRVAMRRPVVFVERDERGEFPVRALLTNGRPSATAASAESSGAASPATEATPMPAVTVAQLAIEDGTVRFVDRTVSFTEELKRMWVRVAGFGTAANTKPASYELQGAVDGTARVTAKGTVRVIGGPLHVDGVADVRDYLVPRVNPYLKQYISWTARDGRFSTTARYRADGDELEARSDVRIGHLDLIRVAQDDPAQRRIGLPLGVITSMMKNGRGDIVLALPVGGRLSDPQFELGEVVWSAVRAITFKTIAAPVAWIGRLRVTPDSRIQDIEIDPVAFTAGGTALTPAGSEQIDRLNGYLRSSAGAKMVLTPVITVGDLDALREMAVRRQITDLARARAVSELAAAQQLHAERRGGDPPATLADIVTALRDTEPPPAGAAHKLAQERVSVVRDRLRKAGIDPARLEPSRDTDGLEAPAGGRVELAITDRVRPRRGLLAELIAKLLEAIQRI